MKVKNKKTGDVFKLNEFCLYDNKGYAIRPFLKSLAELNEEWEDYEEPKDYYFIRSDSLTIGYSPISNTRSCRNRKQIGNYFETKEEAEKAVEKLKAWQRLKDAGFKFGGWTHTPTLTGYDLHIKAYSDKLVNYMEDLQILFGDEE